MNNKIINKIYKTLTKNKLVVIIIIILGVVGTLYSFWPNTQTIQPLVITNMTPEQICDTAGVLGCFKTKKTNIVTPNNCKNNITFTEGIVGKSLLIDECDILFIEPNDKPIKSGTVYLLADFLDGKKENNRYLFDAAESYNKNRISIYLQPDGYLTFSLFDNDHTSIQIREKINEIELKSWIQVGITWNESDGTLKLYINEKLRRTRTIGNINFNKAFEGIFIGSNIQGFNQVNAIIDEVRISSKPLPDKYFEQTYFNLIGKEGYGNLGPVESLVE
jgi:hypothetical protein